LPEWLAWELISRAAAVFDRRLALSIPSHALRRSVTPAKAGAHPKREIVAKVWPNSQTPSITPPLYGLHLGRDRFLPRHPGREFRRYLST